MDPTKEKVVGCALAGGCGLAGLSAFFIWLFALAGGFRATATRNAVTGEITDAGTWNWIPLAVTFFTIGLLLMLGAVVYGLILNKTQARGPRRVIEHAFIVGRYALSKTNDMLSDWELEAAENPRFFVRMRTPDGRSSEYLCAAETYFNCGEGMSGEAELQGRWLGRFTPYIGVPSSV